MGQFVSSNKSTQNVSNNNNSTCNVHNENKEGTTLLWFDPNIGSREDTLETQKMLRCINDYVIFHTDLEECVKFIQSVEKETILLITSGSKASQLLPRVASLRQIDSIFIFCMKKSRYEYLIDEYSKINGIYVQINDLCQAIKCQTNLIDKQLQTFSFFDQRQKATRDLSRESTEFLWFQLFHHIINRLPRNQQSKQQMIEICRQYYHGNTKELKLIDQFEQEYQPEEAIRWYTKDSFVYKLINKALRTEDIELLYVFRFFVGDLSKNLENEHEKLLSSNEEMFTVYRGVHLDKEEFHRLKQNQGQLISTNGYLSTSRNRSKANGFALRRTIITNHKNEKTEKQSATIVFGKLMCDLGKYDQSQKYFEQLLQNPNGEDIAWIEHNLGRIFHLKGQWEEARYYYNCAYDVMMTEIPARIKDSACVFNNIGLLFNDQVSLLSGIFTSCLILIIIVRKFTRQHIITNLLLANTCACTIELCFSNLIIYGYIISHDFSSNTTIESIKDQKIFCPIRSYFLFTGFSLLYTSYCLQAYYRLLQVIFYRKQSSYMTFICLCVFQWIFSFLLIYPMLYSQSFVYIPSEFFCPIPFTKPLSVTYIAVAVYGVFIAVFISIYTWIYIYARQTTSATIRRRRTIDRNITMLKRMILPTFSLMFLGIAYLILFFQTIANQYRTHFLTYRLSYLFIAIGMSFIHIITILQTPSIRNAISESVYCLKRQRKKTKRSLSSLADIMNTTTQPLTSGDGERIELLNREEIKLDEKDMKNVLH
ncbi:hypothetical protein I4U23_015500 [Adineta vaga]|nr:hypothetical protein I4U23_015500 [Adineta vaga]